MIYIIQTNSYGFYLGKNINNDKIKIISRIGIKTHLAFKPGAIMQLNRKNRITSVKNLTKVKLREYKKILKDHEIYNDITNN